jgi:type 2 lantibiotic biosynthesis protein LanM
MHRSLFERWEKLLSIPRDTLTEAWREEYGAEYDELNMVLNENTEALCDLVISAPWFQDLSQVFTLYYESRCDQALEKHLNYYLLASASWPWVQWARRRLTTLLPGDDHRRAEYAAFADLFLPCLFDRLYNLSERTLILAFNIAKQNGEFNGISSDEKYTFFCKRLQEPEHALLIWQEYPVLCRLLTEVSSRWIAFVTELIGRYDIDRLYLSEVFNAGSNMRHIESVEITGDWHDNGRSVTVLTFSTGQKIVYKPRQVTMEALFGEICDSVGQIGLQYPLRTPRTIDMDTYGWCEFIEHRVASSEEELARFYYRAGGMLGLSHLLCVNDLISENIVACGEYPVPVDVECIMSGVAEDVPGVEDIARHNSLISTGILPSELVGNGVDLSGLGGRGQRDMAPYLVPTSVGHGTEELRIQSIYVPMEKAYNI